MKVNLEKRSFLPEFLSQKSVSWLAARVNEVLSRTLAGRAQDEKAGYWQLVFLQSKVNGCSYRGEALPPANWQWPTETWFQEKMGHRRKMLELGDI